MAKWHYMCVVVITCTNAKRGTKRREGEVEGEKKKTKKRAFLWTKLGALL
jgi:hypothetical protein